MARPSLTTLLHPSSVAIVGLSADPKKHGSRVLANLRKYGYTGDVYGVNPRGGVLQGVPAAPSLLDCPATPDVVVAAVPASSSVEVVEQAGVRGCAAVVLFGGGFAESGEEGERIQRELARTAREHGIRLLGPNSGGVIVPGSGVTLSFLTCLDRPADELRSGRVAVVTQSGGTGSYLHNLAAERCGGLRASISTGNEADVTMSEAIEALADLEGVGAIAVVMETVRDGERFIRAVRRAHQAGRPVSLCRLGRSARGQELMRTHTGALATEERIMQGLCEALGLTLTATPGELLDVAQILADARPPKGPRVGVVTHSGGVGILSSDLAAGEGLNLPEPPEMLAGKVRKHLQHGSVSNPVDLGAIIGGPQRFVDVVREFLESGAYDVVLAVTTPHPPAHTNARAQGLSGLAAAGSVPLVNLWMAGDLGRDGLALLRRSAVAVTEEPRAAFRALRGMVGLWTGRDWTAEGEGSPELPAPVETWSRVVQEAPAPEVGGTFSEHTVKTWLRAAGIPVVPGDRVHSHLAATRVAEQVGYPVVAKANAMGLAHKTRAGGVRLRLETPAQVEEAFDAVRRAVATSAPEAQIDGVLIEKFAPGPEVIIGCVQDKTFGPLVLVGLGGVDVESRGIVTVAPAPVSPQQALHMLLTIPTGQGTRQASAGGRLPEALPLARIVAMVSRHFHAVKDHISELEINPLTLSAAGWQVVDAVARMAGDEAADSRTRRVSGGYL